jgi:hypothetical protein
MELNWKPAPHRTSWGNGMMEAFITLSKDETMSVFAHKDALDLVKKAIADMVKSEPAE